MLVRKMGIKETYFVLTFRGNHPTSTKKLHPPLITKIFKRQEAFYFHCYFRNMNFRLFSLFFVSFIIAVIAYPISYDPKSTIKPTSSGVARQNIWKTLANDFNERRIKRIRLYNGMMNEEESRSERNDVSA